MHLHLHWHTAVLWCSENATLLLCFNSKHYPAYDISFDSPKSGIQFNRLNVTCYWFVQLFNMHAFCEHSAEWIWLQGFVLFQAKKKELARRDEIEDGDSMISSATSDAGSSKRKRYVFAYCRVWLAANNNNNMQVIISYNFQLFYFQLFSYSFFQCVISVGKNIHSLVCKL